MLGSDIGGKARVWILILVLLAACERAGPPPAPASGARTAPAAAAPVEPFSPERAANEAEWFPRRLAQLERIMAEGSLPEVVVLVSGRRLEGRVLDDGGDAVVLEVRGGRVPVARPMVKEILRASPIQAEFKWRAGQTEPAKLLAWALDQGLDIHREYLAYRILSADPGHEAARAAAGYRRAEDGQGWTLDPSRLVDAATAARPRATRAGLAELLEAAGYVREGERWHGPVAWSAVLDTLHDPGPWKWTLDGIHEVLDQEGMTPMAKIQNLEHQNPKGPARLKFLAPVRRQGTVTIPVEAPGPLIGCRIKATSELLRTLEGENVGRIEVSVAVEGGEPAPVFARDEQIDQEFHDISEHVRGRTRFSIVARLSTRIDRFHTYARFLPSLPETREVLAVRGLVRRPAPEIDALWAAAKAP